MICVNEFSLQPQEQLFSLTPICSSNIDLFHNELKFHKKNPTNQISEITTDINMENKSIEVTNYTEIILYYLQ